MDGEIIVTVSDPYGDRLPGAVGVLKDGSGAAREMVSNADGEMRFAGLAPGEYALAVTEAGFKPVTRSGLKVGPGTVQALQIALHLALPDEG